MPISETPAHPLPAAVAAMHAALDEVSVTGVDPLYLPMPQKGSLLRDLTALAARVSALRADVLAVADDLADQTADRSPGTWLAAETHTDRREAIHDERLGAALRDRWPQVGEAVRAGRTTWQQAGVVSQALHALPDTLDAELVTKTEAHLLAEAGQFGSAHLRRLGRKVLDVVAPDIAHDHEHRLLLAEERRAERPPGSRSDPGATAPPTCTPGSPTWSRAGSRPTSTPTPHPAASRWTARSTSCPCPDDVARRSAPCWSTCRARACRGTGAPPPRSWS